MKKSHLLSIAPMLDYTDRHFRYLLRLISKHTRLYTEMITCQALLHGDASRWLSFDASEHPVAIQLGGSDPKALALCAQMSEQAGFDEVNLNIGCPSPRVQSGAFGACLMAEPDLVADCVAAMKEAVNIPITVKTRIGIDKQDSYEPLYEFIHKVSEAGCDIFIIHARKAWLKGLSPKENRNIPPLRYDVVKQAKQDFPDLTIILNGGITDLQHVQYLQKDFDGVMLGRAIQHNPYLLAKADQMIFGEKEKSVTRIEVIDAYCAYMAEQLTQNVPITRMTRHLIHLYQGEKGARSWRRSLTEGSQKKGAGVEIIQDAFEEIQRQQAVLI